MDELEKIFALVGQYGWQPILGVALLLLVLRLGKPELVAPAIGTVYADVRKAVGTWWDTHRELVEAQRDRARAQEARDRALEVAWSAAHPEGTRAIDRLVYGPPTGGGDPRATGERLALEGAPGHGGDGAPVGTGGALRVDPGPPDGVAPGGIVRGPGRPDDGKN